MKQTLSAVIGLLATLFVASCAIDDNIPLPFVDAQITAFEVEGQCNAEGTSRGDAIIDADGRKVTVYVADTMDVARLRVTRFEVSNNATIVPDETACKFPASFPTESFDSIGTSIKTTIDLTSPAHFVLRTYQDYPWTVEAQQVVNRKIRVRGQVGKAVIDPVNETAVVYVGYDEDLRNIHVETFTLGGEHGTVSPDPTTFDEGYDFTTSREFDVTYGWSDDVHRWQVFVYQTDEIIGTTAEALPRTVDAIISGNLQNGTEPVVTYRTQGESDWLVVDSENIVVDEASYTARITGLTPATTYEYRVVAGASDTDVMTFTTTEALQLPNASLDEWHTTGSGKTMLYNPWNESDESYWDTGNRGATTVGASNSTYVTEGDRTYANLQSKYIVVKFAAGNIFTGAYLATEGTNGVLGFGRPFEAFPTKLTFDYRCTTGPINRTGAWNNAYGTYIQREVFDNLKNQPDTCNVYVALLDDFTDDADRDINTYKGTVYPYLIRTSPKDLHLFDPKGKRVIAYGQFSQGSSVSEWTNQEIVLNYRRTDRRPKYIMVVASSSKYGDYFTGSDQSVLQLDNFQLHYE